MNPEKLWAAAETTQEFLAMTRTYRTTFSSFKSNITRHVNHKISLPTQTEVDMSHPIPRFSTFFVCNELISPKSLKQYYNTITSDLKCFRLCIHTLRIKYQFFIDYMSRNI